MCTAFMAMRWKRGLEAVAHVEEPRLCLRQAVVSGRVLRDVFRCFPVIRTAFSVHRPLDGLAAEMSDV